MITWSYSSLKTFEQCPKKYYHLRVLKDVKDEGSEATFYGQALHKAAEDYIKDGTPIPPKFSYVQPTVDVIKNIPGEKHCEMKLGVRKTESGYEPCDFFAPDVWWRGIGDVVVVQDELAFSLDYKTSKSARYADVKQLDLVAAGLFAKFPTIQRVKSALIFVVSKEFVKAEHYREMVPKYMEKPSQDVARIEAAQRSTPT